MELRSIGGVYSGNIKPTPFLCLLLKMLQIQPEKDIVIEFIKQDEFKYVRALGAFYFRLVYGSLDCYKYLEPLLNDYRKMRLMDRNGQYHLIHMDEYIDCMMREERYCDIIFPRIQKRWVHEECNDLEARVSLLDDDLEDLESDSEEEEPPPPPPTRAKAEEIGSRSGGRMDRHIRDSHYPPLPLDPGRGDHDKGREKRRRSRDRTNNDRSRMERDQRKRHRHRSPQDHRHRPERDSRDHRDREARDHRRGGGDVASRHRGHEKERQPRREKGHRNGAKDHKSISSKRSRVKDDSNVDVEVAQANALRAELGLPPLRM